MAPKNPNTQTQSGNVADAAEQKKGDKWHGSDRKKKMADPTFREGSSERCGSVEQFSVSPCSSSLAWQKQNDYFGLCSGGALENPVLQLDKQGAE